MLDPKGAYTGTALGIDPEGELLVKRDDDGKTVKVWSGEVSVRICMITVSKETLEI